MHLKHSIHLRSQEMPDIIDYCLRLWLHTVFSLKISMTPISSCFL